MRPDTYQHFQQGSDVRLAFAEAVEQAEFLRHFPRYDGEGLERAASYVVIDESPRTYQEARWFVARLIAAGDERVALAGGPAGAVRVRDDVDRYDPRAGHHTETMDGWLFFGWTGAADAGDTDDDD